LANIGAGVRGLTQAWSTGGGGGKRKVPNPDGSKGGPAHRATVQRRIEELEAQGHRHTHGGLKKEEVVKTEGGFKPYRRPDITTQAPDGSEYRENVGLATKAGEPVSRERRALSDIERGTKSKPGFTPYNR